MTEKTRARSAFQPGYARLAALVLTALALCAALALPTTAQAAEWMQPYLDQVQEWGVMRGDANGNMNEDRSITRAEFVTLVNRAFGYKDVGPNPFTDVDDNAWYAEDIRIAHQAGYFQGTSANTASPMALVTREQAAALLGRCLRFQGVTGAANSTFTDMTDIGGWSRGLVQEAADLGIIQGYSDGTFRPQEPITRGQMACFLVRALGTLVQEPGEQTSGGVYGNLTITTPGVKLKDTTVTGNLYLTGGVGLGNVELENVTVLGKIIICGTGEAESGKNSVILRNVTAGSLEVDPLTEQFLSVQAEGLTSIGEAVLRSTAYLEDRTEDGLGFQSIKLDGPDGALFQLAGNIKRVVDLTPNSTLQVAQGVADVVTMDEKAAGGKVIIDNIAYIRELNLDTATDVSGDGSIEHLNVNAPDSKVSMLPDTIYVRPGITGNINGSNMDNKTATESSEDPRILAGYPAARNVAPTSAEAVFRTNKPGTIRWALTSLMDGSVGEEQLLNPGSYHQIIKSGTINVTTSNQDFTARLTGLTKQGSYYISALLEDARGKKSPVKVAAFTTPDDTAPNFASGYPQAPILTLDADGEQVAQIMVMANKDCQMYYVLLPKGSTAPTAADFRAGALPGNLGHGVVTLRKNTPFLVSRINTSFLQEKTDYDLYLWLNDADNGKSSAVRKITLTTKDITPPTITSLDVKTIAARSVTMTFTMDEPGSLYWVVVKQGASFYRSGVDKNNPNLTGKIQIENGSGGSVIRRGGPVRAARAGTDYTFTVSGLDSQTAYDLYYVAKDLAGNYCVYSAPLIPPMEIHTLDNEPPTVTQEFTNDGDGPASHPTPYPDSTVRLVFSEPVVGARNEGGEWQYDSFEDAYRDAQGGDAAKQLAFANLLKEHIKLYRKPATGRDEPAAERNAANASSIGDNWVIDYRYATVSRDPGTGEMVIAFPYNSAIKLGSGETYYFVVSNIADTSEAHNRMLNSSGNREGYQLPPFTTIDAQLLLTAGNATGTVNGQNILFDMNFRVTPEGTSNVGSDVLWDMIFWADETLAFDLYCDEGGGWQKLGNMEILTNAQQRRSGASFTSLLLGSSNGVPNFEQLNNVRGVRNYGIIITKRGDSTDRGTWSGNVDLTVVPVAGELNNLVNLVDKNLTPDSYKAHQASNYAVREIGVPKEYPLSKPFSDTVAPTFIEGYPYFSVSDTSASIDIMVSRNNAKYFCIVTELGNIPTQVDGITGYINAQTWGQLPDNGEGLEGKDGNASAPSTSSITRGDTYVGPRYLIQNGSCGGNVTTVSFPDSLSPSTKYIAYFVLQGDSPNSASRVYAFRFETPVVSRPVLRATLSNPSVTVESVRTATIAGGTQKDATVSYLVINALQMGQWLNRKMSDYWDTTYAAAMGVSSTQMASAKTSYENLTFAEAMATQYTSGGENLGSVFDLFTSPSVQEQVAAWLQTAQTSGTTVLKVGIDSLNLARGNSWRQSVDCSRELRGVSGQYWFIAAGQGSGSAYAFTAARYLTDPNVTHPVVSSSIIESDSYATREEAAAALSANGISGTLSISFDGPLYYAENGTKLLQVVDTSSVSVGTLGDYTMSSLVIQNMSPNIRLDPKYGTDFNTSNPPQCFGLNFTVTKAKEGATIRFDRYLANQNGDFGTDSLVFTLRVIQDSTGRWRPAFQVATSGWDDGVQYL